MRFSLRLNNDLPIAETVGLAQAAERAGIDQFWLSNDLFLRSGPVSLTAVASNTSRIGLGSCILNPYTIHPVEMAMMAASLDELSGGRFHLGIAAGSAEFLGWVGIEHQRPLAAMRETLTGIRQLLDGKPAPIKGEFLNWTHRARLEFPPERKIPLYLGALSPRMIALGAELADGILPLLFPPEHLFTVQAQLGEVANPRDQGLAELDFAACFWISISDDRTLAEEALARKIAYYGPSLSASILDALDLQMDDFDAIKLQNQQNAKIAHRLVDSRMMRIGIAGGPSEVIERLEPLVEAGANHLSFGPPLGPDPMEAIEVLGRSILPHFQNQ